MGVVRGHSCEYGARPGRANGAGLFNGSLNVSGRVFVIDDECVVAQRAENLRGVRAGDEKPRTRARVSFGQALLQAVRAKHGGLLEDNK